MRNEPEVIVEDSAELLAGKTAQRAINELSAAIRERGVAHLVVTGGGILEKVLSALARPPAALEWSQVHVWWGDERYVPADSDDRNDKPAMALLFDKVDVDPAKLHRMPASDADFDDAEAAADAYAAALASAAGGSGVSAAAGGSGVSAAAGGSGVPAFDVVLLGVGPDGHCASLFPGHPGTRVTDASVIAVHDSPKPPPTRLSLTFPALNAARQVWFVASGDSKADAVAKALAPGADRTEVPSAGPRGTERTLWLVDKEAAAHLPG